MNYHAIKSFAEFCVLIVLCCRWCAADDPVSLREVKTEHYDLYVEGTDGKEAGRLAEELYGDLKRFFNAEPVGRLRVKIMVDHDDLEAAVDADKASRSAHETTGIYSPSNKTAYVELVPGDADATRSVILHECTHQFHFLACASNRTPLSRYYVEGLAEHFALHSWDGRAALVGEIPDIARRDSPATALRLFSEHHHSSFKALATDSGEPDQDEAWGLVSFLISQEGSAFRTWRAALDRGESAEAAWAAAFTGRSDDLLSESYIRWLQTHQEPWHVLRGGWQSSAAHSLEGKALSLDWALAVARLPIETVRFSAEATSPYSLLAVVGDQDEQGEVQSIVEVMPDGSVFVCADHVHWTQQPRAPVGNPRKFDVEVRRQRDGFEVFIDGAPSAKLELPKDCRIGPAVYNGSAVFSNIVVKMMAPSQSILGEVEFGPQGPTEALALVTTDPLKSREAASASRSSRWNWKWMELGAGAAVLFAIVGLAWLQRKRRRA